MVGIPRGVRDVQRFRKILEVSLKYGFAPHIGHRKSGKRITPVRIRKAMEELGGAFVKLAQLLSLRPDLIPPEYCKEFSRLQDNVKPFPDSEAKQVLEQELKYGARLIKLDKRVASASIGQVYKASIHHKDVAIKVMRPGIEEVFRTDLDLLFHIAKLLNKHMKSRIIDPMEIFEQFRMYTENELDYNLEAKNLEIFYENFLKTDIIIPELHAQFSTKKVLTMSFVEGEHLLAKKLSKGHKKRVAQKLANAIFKQIFVDGVFHADPHPGNILLDDKNCVAFLDFGIVGKLGNDMKDKIADLFIALINRDLDGVVDSLMHLNLVRYSVNRGALKSDVNALLGRYFDNELWATSLSEMIMSTIHTAKKHDIKLPKDYVLLGKCFVTLEGVGKELYPEYNLVKEARPFVRDLVYSRFSPKQLYKNLRTSTPRIFKFLSDVPSKANYFISEVQSVDERLGLMDSDMRKLHGDIVNSSNRLVMALVISALIVAFAIVMTINHVYALIILLIALLLGIDLLYWTWKYKAGG